MGGSPKYSLHFPDWRAGGNYYQQNLADALAAIGQPSVFATYSGYWFPLSVNALRHKVSLIHIHWVLSINGSTQKSRPAMYRFLLMFLADVLLLRIFGLRIVWTVHNLRSHDATFPAEDLFSRRFLARHCYRILAHSGAAAEQIADLYRCSPSKIELVPHGNYQNNYPHNAVREESRQRLNLPQEGKVFLALGYMRSYKGLEELVRAFRTAAAPSDILLLAGTCVSESYLTEIKQLADADPRIRFYAHFIPEEEIQYFMAAADVCVFPFKNIFTSGSLILACGFARAVIAPDVPTLKEYIHPEGAVLFDPLNLAEGLVQAIRKTDGLDTDRMGRLNKEVTDQFDWVSIARKVAECYQ